MSFSVGLLAGLLFSFTRLRNFLFVLDSKRWKNNPHILIGIDAKLYHKGQGHTDKWDIVIIFAHCDDCDHPSHLHWISYRLYLAQ